MYRYSWDKEDLRIYPWPNRYLNASEVRAYLEKVVDRHDLRKHMQFDTELHSAKWNDNDCTWTSETSAGTFTSRYLFTALGLVSDPNWPPIPGRDVFQGERYHTSRWPGNVDLRGKRVAVIGGGPSGMQLISDIAPVVGSLLSFQRHPQYTVPAGKRPISEQERNQIIEHHDEIREKERKTLFGMGVEESRVPAMSVSPEERERIFQAAWDTGGSFHFLVGTFSDLISDETANRAACEFIDKKISETVKNPEKRKKLIPSELYARPPVCDARYYQQFNRDNVDVVDVRDNPIARFTRTAIRLQDGTEYERDVIISATGYDALDGPYKKIEIYGRGGTRLKDQWKDGPATNAGVAVAHFPNHFLVYGPQSPFANVPTVIEAQVDFVTEAVSRAEARRRERGAGSVVIESKRESEKEWNRACQEASDTTMFRTAQSYFYGKNVEGKRPFVYVFLGGLGRYREKLEQCQQKGYDSFHPF